MATRPDKKTSQTITAIQIPDDPFLAFIARASAGADEKVAASREATARAAATPDDRPVCGQCQCYGPVGPDGVCHSCRTYDQRQRQRVEDSRALSAADDRLAHGLCEESHDEYEGC